MLSKRLPPILLTAIWPALLSAQWTQEPSVPASNVPSLFVADHLFVGTDSTVFIGSGSTPFARSATLPPAPDFVDGLIAFDGYLYAGTGNHGVFRSADNGGTWEAFSTGLGGLGGFNINNFAVFDGQLYCSTVGAGTFRLNGNAWQPFGTLQTQTAGNVNMLRTIGDRLWAGAGGNGYLWYIESGDTDWTPVLVAPIQGMELMITDIVPVPGALVAGSSYGIYRSTDGGALWDPVPGVGYAENIRLAQWGDTLFAVRNTAYARMYSSLDNGLTWSFREQLPLIYAITAHGGRLYTGRLDGLWYRGEGATGINDPSDDTDFSLYPVPATDVVRLQRGKAGAARVVLLDLHGRPVLDQRIQAAQEQLSVGALSPGIYSVLLMADGIRSCGRLMVQ